MVAFFLVWILDSFLLRVTTFLSSAVPLLLHIALGLIILVIAGYFMDGSHKDLFHDTGSGLATQGVFARVRNPMYLSTVLVYVGLALLTLSLASLLVCCLIAPYYNSLANYEEAKLEEKFGDEFLAYKRTVRKWLPI